GIAGDIEGGDAGLDLAVGGQHAAGYADSPGAAIGIDGGGVAAATDRDGHAVTVPGVAADATAEGDAAGRFGGVDQVIAGDRVEADAGGRQPGAAAVPYATLFRSGIAGVIEGGDAGLDLAVGGQHAAGYADTPRAAIGIDGGGVAAATDRDGHAVTGLDVAADGTAEGDAPRRFGGVEHVIAGDRVEADAGGRQRGVDAVGTVG